MSNRRRLRKYIREYKFSNILEMIRNGRVEPEICSTDCRGKLVVITGATSGIGYSTARKYASHGAELLCINRNEEKSRAVCEEIKTEFGVRCGYRIADMSLMEDVRRVGRELSSMEAPIDVLIHNAGLHMTKREVTAEGLELVFAVNHLSSFILNYVLREKLKSQEKGRILLVNSEGHRFAAWGLRLNDLNWARRWYNGLRSYGSAKTAQLLSMMIFKEWFDASGVTINAMHPGAVTSESGKDNGRIYKWFKRTFIDKILQPAEVSAEALYYLGVSDTVDGITGKFFNLTTEEVPAPPALDMEAARELWEVSLSMGGLCEQKNV